MASSQAVVPVPVLDDDGEFRRDFFAGVGVRDVLCALAAHWIGGHNALTG